MDVSDSSVGPVGPNPSQGTGPGGADKAQEAGNVEEATEGAPATPEESGEEGDRVEISDAARTAQAELSGEDVALVEEARQALSEQSLSSERREELQARIEEGEFNTPEVAGRVAEQLTDVLAGPGESSQ